MHKIVILGLAASVVGTICAMEQTEQAPEKHCFSDAKLRAVLEKICKNAPFQHAYQPARLRSGEQIPSLTTQALLRLNLDGDVFDELNDLLFPDSSIWRNGSEQCKQRLAIIKADSLMHAAIKLGYKNAFSFVFCNLGLSQDQRIALCALRDRAGNTLLHVAALCAGEPGGIHFVRELIAAGADCTCRGGSCKIHCKSGAINDLCDLTPLHMATTVEATRALIAAGADVNAQNEVFKIAPAHIAVAAGFGDILKALICNHASMKVRDWRSKTPLDYAREQGDQESVRLLERAEKSTCLLQ